MMFENTITMIFMIKIMLIYAGGTQKINLLHKAGDRVVYFGKKHQQKVERGGLKRQKI